MGEKTSNQSATSQSGQPTQGRALIDSILAGVPSPADERDTFDSLRAAELRTAVEDVQAALPQFINTDSIIVTFRERLKYNQNVVDLVETLKGQGWTVEGTGGYKLHDKFSLTRPKQGDSTQAKG